MRSRVTPALVLFLLAGCASNPDPETTPDDPTDGDVVSAAEQATVEDEDEAGSGVCRRAATVAVVVDNQSSYDLKLRFGPQPVARIAPGFTRTTYHVPRSYLYVEVQISIWRGGLQVGRDAVIPTEPVFCNDATLVVGSQPRYSIFYGAELHEPLKKGEILDPDPEEERDEEPDSPW